VLAHSLYLDGGSVRPKSIFEIDECKIGGGFYVRVTFADGMSERIEMDTFSTEGEAGRWIKNEPIAWAHERRAVVNRVG
jgi:hypothetical protein